MADRLPPEFDETDDGYGEGSARRRASLVEMISPARQLHWLLHGLECWVFSRDNRSLLLGAPFVVAGLAVIALLWWLNHASLEPVIARFEEEFNAAVKTGDVEKQELCLSGLMQYRPNSPEYQMQLGLFLVGQDRVDEGLAYLVGLASDDDNEGGYIPARMWLVQQAQQDEPYLKLEPEQIEGQLIRVVEQQEDNVDAHQMLAELYIQKKEWELAEEHLLDAALQRPELNLAVAKLRQSLNRSPQSILDHTNKAEEALKDRLSSNRFDPRIRIALAETKVLLGKLDEARELLVSGVESADGPEVRRALSDFDVQTAQRRLKESIVNRDVALQQTIQALQIDPTNPRAITLLARLQTLGATVPEESVQAAIVVWRERISSEETTSVERSLLSQLLALGGETEEAARVLEPLLTEIPDLRLRYAALLKRSGQLEEAGEILDDLLDETRAAAAEDPADFKAAARHAEVLLMARQLHEIVVFLHSHAEPGGDSRIPEQPNLRHLYGLACLELYDLSRNQPDALKGEDPLQLLTEAVQVSTTSGPALDRVVKLAFSDDPQAEQAMGVIDRFRTVAESNGNILSLLGLYSLQAGKLSDARSYLEQANAQTRGQNIMVLNNLAIALVRMDPSDPRRALSFVDEALEMSPEHPDLLSTRGEIYVALERWPEAAADLKKSLATKPDSPSTHQLLVEVYTALNEPSQADYHRQRSEELQGS